MVLDGIPEILSADLALYEHAHFMLINALHVLPNKFIKSLFKMNNIFVKANKVQNDEDTQYDIRHKMDPTLAFEGALTLIVIKLLYSFL